MDIKNKYSIKSQLLFHNSWEDIFKKYYLLMLTVLYQSKGRQCIYDWNIKLGAGHWAPKRSLYIGEHEKDEVTF